MNIKITRKISAPVFTVLALIIFCAANITAAAGDIDLSFGSGGFVVTPIGGYSVAPRTILTQPDGKILVCGMIYDDADNDESFFLARYQPNGTLDASFGTNGKIIAPFDYSGVYTGSDIALQSDGKIVAVGLSYFQGNGFAVRRYNANGTLDASFGTGGLVITRVGTLGFETAQSVAIQPDSKIVVVGHTYTGVSSHSDFAVVRYNPNGSLDTSFNDTGKVITSFDVSSSTSALVFQPDGKIVAVGSARTSNNTSAFALARYNTDGSLDSGFGTGGKVIHAVSTSYNYIRDAVLQPDGKIVATGATYSNQTTSSAIVRYNTNGSIDTSFAQNGIFATGANFSVGNSIALQSDGKLFAFGSATQPYRSAIVRLNPNGTPDTSFGTNGRVTPNHRAVSDGALQSDGKVLTVAGGYMTDSIEIVRYRGDSAVPRPAQFDFDGDGLADLSVFRPSDRVWYLNQSTNGFSATQFGLSTDTIVPADYDGDGRTDIAVYRDGVWYWLNSSNGSFNAVQFGLANDISSPNSAHSPIPGIPSDIPVPGDYTGDGRPELAVYRGGTWWMLDLANGQVSNVQFGLVGDKPVAADYDGDGSVDQAVYRGNGEWYLNQSTQGFKAVNFGLATDRPVPADYDGDGKTDLAVYRAGVWYLLQSANGFAAFQWGLSSDVPAPADYDGDGKTDAAIYRNGQWWLRQSTAGIAFQQFGLAGDKPVPAAYLPQ